MRAKELIKRASVTINSCQQSLEAAIPILNQLLRSKKFIAELARRGLAVDVDSVNALQREIIAKTYDLKVGYRKGETMQTNGEVLDAKQFLLVIKQAFKASGKPSITQWAEALGVSYQFLSHVMRGDYNPGPAMAKALGYEQIYGFRRKTVFNSADIRKGIAALKGKDMTPRTGASRRATKAAAAHTNGHHGKKTQAKKK